MNKLSTLLSAALLAGCASYDGRGLLVGQSSLDDVTQIMGPPAMQWVEANGAKQLAYPRGPAGVHTYMVRVGPDGKLQRIQNVMDMPFFAEIKEGMSVDEVTKILGPSVPLWTQYFARRDELVLGWRYCDDWNQLARFYVMFDATKKTVRSTMSQQESQAPESAFSRGGFGCSK
jgi:hypothetical protein